MKTYKVLLNGQNFLIDVEGKVSRKGFYASRITLASSEEEAQKLAMKMIISDRKLNKAIKNLSSEPPKIFVEQIELLKTEISIEEQKKVNETYMFYEED